jgi:hypothetical protein
MMTMIEGIRKTYPHPIMGCDAHGGDGEYCVGGALMLSRPVGSAARPTAAFPTPRALAQRLRELNSALDFSRALAYASAIIVTNDQGRFALAWGIADIALLWIPEQDRPWGDIPPHDIYPE